MNKSNKLKKSKKYKFRKNTRKLMGGSMTIEQCRNSIKQGIIEALDSKLTNLNENEQKEFVEQYKKKITASLG